MGKAEGNSASNTLNRLYNLVGFLTECGNRGATWNEIKNAIYSDSEIKEASLLK